MAAGPTWWSRSSASRRRRSRGWTWCGATASIDIGNIVPQTVSFPAIKVITQQIHWTGLMHYNPWIMPAALEFLVRTQNRYPLTKVVSHSFPLAEVNAAFAFAEWQGKSTGTAATRVILKP